MTAHGGVRMTKWTTARDEAPALWSKDIKAHGVGCAWTANRRSKGV